MGEHPIRLVTAAAFVLLGAATLVASSSMAGDEPQRPAIVASPEIGQDDPPARATVTLIMAGPGGDEEPAIGSGEDPVVEPDDDPSEESAAGRPADRAASGVPSSQDHVPQVTAGTLSEPEPDPAPSDPTIEPELSDAGETHEQPASEPDSPDSPEPETPEDETDTDHDTCLLVNALGLTVDVCLLSLLG